MLSPFEQAVARVLSGLERGDVVTYGEVAEEAGHPGAHRAVGRFLRDHDGFPWWRVVTSTGRLVPGHEAVQTGLLTAEGVVTRDGTVVGSSRKAHPADRRSSRRARYPDLRSGCTEPPVRAGQEDHEEST